MKLTYRGVNYDYQPSTLEAVDSGLVGQYRGQVVNFRYPRHIPAPAVVCDLKYRGVAYRNDGSRSAQVESKAPAHVTDAIDAALKARSVAEARQALLAEVAHTHHQNIYRTLKHRIEVARIQGNEVLLRQLEAEMHQIA